MSQPQLLDIVLSVDNDEWYFGKPENRTKAENRRLMKREVSSEEIVSPIHVKQLNDLFYWTETHEKESLKRKKRPLYVDNGFFV